MWHDSDTSESLVVSAIGHMLADGPLIDVVYTLATQKSTNYICTSFVSCCVFLQLWLWSIYKLYNLALRLLFGQTDWV